MDFINHLEVNSRVNHDNIDLNTISGSFECLTCGVGKTTLTERSTNEEECRDECPGIGFSYQVSGRFNSFVKFLKYLDGEHISSSGACQPCSLGTYRTKGEHKECISCPPGKLTVTTKS